MHVWTDAYTYASLYTYVSLPSPSDEALLVDPCLSLCLSVFVRLVFFLHVSQLRMVKDMPRTRGKDEEKETRRFALHLPCYASFTR